MNSKLIKLLVVFLIPCLVWFTNPPQGLNLETWRLFGLMMSLLSGLILQPLPAPVISLAIIGISSLILPKADVLFTGYATQGVWFILVVLIAFNAFQKTGLGKRLAYILLSKFSVTKFGRTSLGLGYIMMICDFVLSPATGSNTSRSAIVFPIFKGVAESLGSYPDKEPRKLGAYLELLEHVVAMSTAVMFLTGMASNAVIASTIKSVANIELSWMLWFQAALVPGGLVLLLSPLIVYKLYPPTLKTFDGIKELVDKELDEMGSISKQEKLLLLFFFLAMAGWMVGPNIGIGMYAVAFGFLALQVLFGILDWNDIMNSKEGWNIFIWYGAFFSLSNAISKGGFYKWLSAELGVTLNLAAFDGFTVLILLMLLSFAVKYFFVSNAAYIASIYPLILTLAAGTHVNMMTLALMLAFFGGYGALVCNYGNGASIYLFGNRYVSTKDWFLYGTIILFIIFGIFLAIGIPYWTMLNLI